MTMAEKKQQKSYTPEFKKELVKYVKEHPDETKISIASKFGISDSLIYSWVKQAEENGGDPNGRGSGNYSSDMAKENARLKKELKDTQDALEVLKKAIGILGK